MVDSADDSFLGGLRVPCGDRACVPSIWAFRGRGTDQLCGLFLRKGSI